jgi:hypothetical protein
MSHTRLLVVATIIAGIILAGFVLSVPHTRDSILDRTSSTATTSIPVVAIRDVFKKGVHTITGSLSAPNACTTVSAEATLVGDASSTQNILVAISMPKDVGICLQKETVMKFSTTIAAPAKLPIVTSVNGVLATTTAS